MRYKDGGYEFEDFDGGTEVFFRGKRIGEIYGMKERNGRHCFRLGFDNRRKPRTYRGRVQAAAALKLIDGLATKAAGEKWDVPTLVVMAWDAKPKASPDQA